MYFPRSVVLTAAKIHIEFSRATTPCSVVAGYQRGWRIKYSSKLL